MRYVAVARAIPLTDTKTLEFQEQNTGHRRLPQTSTSTCPLLNNEIGTRVTPPTALRLKMFGTSDFYLSETITTVAYTPPVILVIVQHIMIHITLHITVCISGLVNEGGAGGRGRLTKIAPKSLWCKEKHLPGNGVNDVPPQLEIHHAPTIMTGTHHAPTGRVQWTYPAQEQGDVTPTKRVGICVYCTMTTCISSTDHRIPTLKVRVTDYDHAS